MTAFNLIQLVLSAMLEEERGREGRGGAGGGKNNDEGPTISHLRAGDRFKADEGKRPDITFVFYCSCSAFRGKRVFISSHISFLCVSAVINTLYF